MPAAWSSRTPRALIAAHIEPQVVEVYGEGAEAWAASAAGTFSSRVEVSGKTAFCYVADAGILLMTKERYIGAITESGPVDTLP